jgi:tetratricopeptide (TPR) repeat protein
MIKALAVGLGLALSSGVVFAQAKKAPRKAPAGAHKKTDPKAPADATPATPDATPTSPPADARPDATTPAASPAAPIDAVSSPRPRTPVAGNPAASNKTDEKAGVNESLEKGNANPWVVGVTVAEQQAALVAFRDGNLQLNDGLFVNAVTRYREALKHWNHPAIHYNLSLALLNLDQPIEVFEELNKALQYGAAPLEKDKYDHAKDYLLLVEKQLADIEVSCDKVGAKVSVDGKEVFTAPGKFSEKIRVGKHTFHAVKEGHNARIVAPYIGPGEKYRIELKVYTVDDTTRYRTKWHNTWFPYVVLGAGAAVGLVAGGLELSAQSSYDQFNTKVAACNTMAAGCPTGTPGVISLRDSGDTKRTLGYVGYGVAGAALATGAVLLWINRRQAYQITPEELEAAPPPIAIAPLVSPEAVGAMVQGHF